jgi:hypothetical protein
MPLVALPNQTAIRETTVEILSIAARRNLDSAELIAAIADVVGLTAATLDRRDDRAALADRLHAFCQRVEAKYAVVRAAREAEV